MKHNCPTCGRSWSQSLSEAEFATAALLADGFRAVDIARDRKRNPRTVKKQLYDVYVKLGISGERKEPRLAYVKLAVWWNCELFQLGLRELGLTPVAA